MRQDLQGLEITKGELRKLSGIDPEQVFRRSVMQDAFKRSQFWQRHTLEVGFLTLLSFVSFAVVFSYLAGGRSLYSELRVFGSVAIGSLVLAILIQSWRIIQSTSPALAGLLDDVDRYNAMVKAIHINDQIEAAGNFQVRLQNRSRVIEALRITRANIVRALKTERILRENKPFIDRNPDLFADSLLTLESLQVTDQASEHGRLLNEALQIGLSVQDEMRKLQNRH